VNEYYQARKQYIGPVARDYDRDRNRSPYDRWKWRRERATLSRTLEALGVMDRVLDVPTGTGRFLELLFEGSRRTIGLDLSPDMLMIARHRAEPRGIPLVCAEAECLPFADGTFDLAVSIRFFQHLPPAALEPILRELVRVSSGGLLLQAPLSNPVSPLVRVLAKAARGRFGHGTRRSTQRYFPRSKRELIADLDKWNLVLAAARPVTWRGGQLRLMHIRQGSRPS